jgi:hypothetical protein
MGILNGNTRLQMEIIIAILWLINRLMLPQTWLLPLADITKLIITGLFLQAHLLILFLQQTLRHLEIPVADNIGHLAGFIFLIKITQKV